MSNHPSKTFYSNRTSKRIFILTLLSLSVVFLLATCKQEPEAASNPPAEAQNAVSAPAEENNTKPAPEQNLITEIPETAVENSVTLVEEMPEVAPLKNSASFTTETPKVPLKSLANVKRMLENRQYYALTRLTFSKTQLPQLYYKANAYYVLSLTEKRGSAKHIAYARKAKALFERVARHTRSARLRNRAALWHGITTFRYPSRREGSKEQLQPFSYLLRKAKNTALYNDALLYSAFVYTRYKNFAEAERLYRLLGKTAARDGVYDYRIKKVVSPQRASAFYLSRLAALRKQSKPATPSLQETVPPVNSTSPQVDSEEVIPFPEEERAPIEEEFLESSTTKSSSENQLPDESEAAISSQEEAAFFAPQPEIEFEATPEAGEENAPEVLEIAPNSETSSLNLAAPFLKATPLETPLETPQLEAEDTEPETLQNQ